MKIFKLLFAFAIFMTCTVSSLTANAADWQELGTNNDVKISINADNITRVNGVYTVWLRSTYPEDKQPLKNGQKMEMQLEKLAFRTTESGDEWQLVEIYQYNTEGKVIQQLDGDSSWDSIVPGTLGEAVYDKVKEIRKDADAADDKKAKSKKRQQETKEAVKQAANIAGGILGGLF